MALLQTTSTSPMLSRTIQRLVSLWRRCGLTSVRALRYILYAAAYCDLLVDYMDHRRIFTVDPQYFPLNRMRQIVSYLHDHDQRYGAIYILFS